MKSLFSSFLALALALNAHAQNENVGQDLAAVKFSNDAQAANGALAADTAWKLGGNFGLQFNQSAYSNWQAGGVNSISGNGLLNVFANYDRGGKWSWDNSLTLGYGLNFQDSIYNKTDDRIELESRVDYQFSKHWSASGLLNFRSQFTSGFANPGESADSLKVSDFMAPGYLLTGFGLTYKPNKKFTAFISPFTQKNTFVLDQRLADAGSYGVEPGENVRTEIGGYVNMTFKQKLMKNVDLQARLDLYSNYLTKLTRIDVNSEFLLFFKVNKYITANLALNLIYDHDVKFDVNNDGVLDGPRTQFREIFGIGFSYNFGEKN